MRRSTIRCWSRRARSDARTIGLRTMTPHAAASAVASTFSIVAADPAAGQVGVAVQSKYLAVGAVVPWARAGVGAVATQAMGFAGFGPQILEALARGEAPAQALAAALRDDPLPARRQLGVVSASRAAANPTRTER